MKKLIWLFVILFSFSAFNNLKAYDTTAAKYLPLQIGNVWVYSSVFVNEPILCHGYEKYIISGTTIINGKTFYVRQRKLIASQHNCDSFYVGSRLFNQVNIRLDSLSCNIYKTNDCLIDSLEAENGDSEQVCAGMYSPAHCYVINDTIFGLIKPAKIFDWSNIEAAEDIMYVKDIGLTSYQLEQPNFFRGMYLQGCIINGVLYGDTSMIVGLQNKSLDIPNSFSLLQNYPNPFNPSTNIKFQIAKTGNAKLIIYDALGREISTLINKQLQPGTYEAEWDGINFPSGVYFYKLESGGYVQTLKMVLIK